MIDDVYAALNVHSDSPLWPAAKERLFRRNYRVLPTRPAIENLIRLENRTVERYERVDRMRLCGVAITDGVWDDELNQNIVPSGHLGRLVRTKDQSGRIEFMVVFYTLDPRSSHMLESTYITRKDSKDPTTVLEQDPWTRWRNPTALEALGLLGEGKL